LPGKECATVGEGCAETGAISQGEHPTLVSGQNSSAGQRGGGETIDTAHDATPQNIASFGPPDIPVVTAAAGEVMHTYGGRPESAPVSHATESTSNGLSSPAYRIVLHRPSSTPELYYSEEAMRAIKVMDTILLDCVELNFSLGKYANITGMGTMSTKKEMIQKTARKIIEMDYVEAVEFVNKVEAHWAAKVIQVRYNESMIWNIIKKAAARLDPTTLKTPKGVLDEFSRTEKKATETFMKEAGIGRSPVNQGRCRRLWKNLHDMREAGLGNILLYRTKKLDFFCTGYPNDEESAVLESVLSWAKIYDLHILRLEAWATELRKGDWSGISWLKEPHIAGRLEVPDSSWNCANNVWLSDAERVAFTSLPGSAQPLSSDELGVPLDIKGLKSGSKNKSVFVSLLTKDEAFLWVCPVITINEDDRLGVFAGHLRHSESFDTTHGIKGPRENLWLDYSQ
ncbi:hypothetical protein TOPH_09296, partial [Tolypocladium ophioglossoides CBS 100239]